jgi:hypothetical protein
MATYIDALEGKHNGGDEASRSVAEHLDKNGFEVRVGDTVVVDDPKDTDDWNHCFSGQVDGFKSNGDGTFHAVVVDGDGCTYAVDLSSLQVEDC